jgi:hypothetical protein
LIGALSAGEKDIFATEYGLARPWQARDRDDQIDVYRTEDHDHVTAPSSDRLIQKA